MCSWVQRMTPLRRRKQLFTRRCVKKTTTPTTSSSDELITELHRTIVVHFLFSFSHFGTRFAKFESASSKRIVNTVITFAIVCDLSHTVALSRLIGAVRLCGGTCRCHAACWHEEEEEKRRRRRQKEEEECQRIVCCSKHKSHQWTFP